MWELTGEVLEKLTCYQCKNYLSFPPILLNTDGSNLCGRCYSKTENPYAYTRNKLYETVAEMLKFPCRYNTKGCSNEFSGKDMKFHEENCSFAERNCWLSSDTNCGWTGSNEGIKNHLVGSHGEMIFPNPFEGLVQCGKSIYAIKAFESVFVLTLEYNEETKLCKILVNELNKPEDVSCYKYRCKIFIKEPSLTITSHMSANVDEVITVDVNDFEWDLKEDQLNFEVEITMKNCAKCAKSLETSDAAFHESKYYCKDCALLKNELEAKGSSESDTVSNQSTQT